MILGSDAPEVKAATWQTGGKYLQGDARELNVLFTDEFFERFNSNWRWVIFWLGLTWIALVWMIAMPLDRWIFEGLLKMPMDLGGKLALFHALFWTAATPGIIWKIYQLLDLTLPFLGSC